MTLEIEFYETTARKCPVKELINRLPVKLAVKLIRDIDLLEKFGLDLGAPFIKQIYDSKLPKLFELRTRFGSDIVRVFFFMVSANRAMLLSGFIKKTDKTPKMKYTEQEK